MEVNRTEKELARLKIKYSAMQSKNAVQRSEIARLSQAVEQLRGANKKLVNEIKWMQGRPTDDENSSR